MISKTAIDHLIEKLGPKNVLFEKEDLLVLGYDSTPGLHHLPDIVVYPTSTDAAAAPASPAARCRSPAAW
jgi:glycolate oxidase